MFCLVKNAKIALAVGDALFSKLSSFLDNNENDCYLRDYTSHIHLNMKGQGCGVAWRL